MFFRIGLKKVSSTKGRQGKMNILENFASRSRTFSSTFDPPTVKTYSLKTLFILLSLTCFCSLLTICSGQDCTPVYYGPRIPYDDKDLKKVTGPNAYKSIVEATLPNRNILVDEGVSFVLRCTLNRFNSVKWRLDHEDIVSDDVFLIGPETFENHGLITTELRARNVSRNHSGEYKCVASGCLNGSKSGLSIRVIYAEKPLIDFQATKPRYSKVGQDVEFIVPAVIGKPANISCITKTIPGLSAKWRKQIETESKWQDLVVFEKCEEKRDEEAIIEEMKWVQKDSGKKKEKSVPQCFIFNVGLADGSRNMTLFFTNLTQSDLGNYSCGYTNYPTNPEHSKTDTIVTLEAAVVRVKREKTQPTLRDPPITYRLPNKTSINIVAFRKFRGGLNSLTVLEGEPAYIYCNLTWPGLNSGYTVRWTKDDVQFEAINSTLTTNATLSMITIESVSLLDRGMYKCMIVDSNQFTVSSFPYQLRIRNKMAALWPFIAICVEVVIICLIILIYEKTKNKAEVAESDTDGSPDQKNVSDNNDGASERLQPKE